MFRAFWEEGQNIGTDDVLRGLFEECGMDWEEYEESGEGTGSGRWLTSS